MLVIVHGGPEHWQLPSPRMVETYRFFIDAGADAVVNHHQHCYSGYELYQGKPIFYGLGNFCFDETNSIGTTWNDGYLVMLCFGNEFKIEIFPYRQCAEEPRIVLLPKEEFNVRIAGINSIIEDKDKLLAETKKYYASYAIQYGNIFEPLNNRYYLGAKRRGWLPSFISKKRFLIASNYINCEAHRDKLMWWFDNHMQKQ